MIATYMTEDDILYENGNFWVCRKQFGSGRFRPKSEGYEVYENGITHSKRVAIIGYAGEEGLKRAIAEADKRAECQRCNK